MDSLLENDTRVRKKSFNVTKVSYANFFPSAIRIPKNHSCSFDAFELRKRTIFLRVFKVHILRWYFYGSIFCMFIHTYIVISSGLDRILHHSYKTLDIVSICHIWGIYESDFETDLTKDWFRIWHTVWSLPIIYEVGSF